MPDSLIRGRAPLTMQPFSPALCRAGLVPYRLAVLSRERRKALIEAGLTTAQAHILDYIADFTRLRGKPPTYRQIMVGTRTRSTNTVHFHVKRLESVGKLERDYNGRIQEVH